MISPPDQVLHQSADEFHGGLDVLLDVEDMIVDARSRSIDCSIKSPTLTLGRSRSAALSVSPRSTLGVAEPLATWNHRRSA
jgi:hypothetical protein